jgi:hypothetical protein
MVTELDDTLPHLMNVIWDSVQATHGLPVEVFAWKMTLGRGRTRPNSFIVLEKGGHSRCLCGSHVSCYQIIFLAMLYIDSNLHNTLENGRWLDRRVQT